MIGTDSQHEGHLRWLGEAVSLAIRSVAEGGGPFGALVVRDGRLLASGHNRVTLDHDPTAHAEVNAIRAAARIAGDYRLTGAVLYASCEPCPMCSAAIHWARLDRVYYAAPREVAAAAGFDDTRIAQQNALPPASRDPACVALPLPNEAANGPFRAWAARIDRLHY